MLNRFKIGLALLILLTISACSGNADDKLTVNSTTEILHETLQPTQVIEEIEELTKDPTEVLLERNFSKTFPLELDEGYYLEEIFPLDENAILLHIRNDELHSRLATFNVQSGAMDELWSSSQDSSVYRRSIQVLDDKTIEWNVYEIGNEASKTYQLTDDRQLSVLDGYNSRSPDGQWTVQYNTQRSGLYGISVSTGEEKQWTKGEFDAQPLWLPDSSGFIYLHDTGEQIGDGAGPYYQLAKYDLQSKTTSIYSFPKGFWGFIEWLEPGVSLVAHHGFDDGVAIKIVNLVEEQQYELLNTIAGYSYTGYDINTKEHELWISEKASFRTYDSQGQLKYDVTWPSDLDEYTALFDAEVHLEHQYYFGGSLGAVFAPQQFNFSPDGNKIAYLLGNTGQSMHDMVTGTRIALANQDGTSTELITSDYLMISSMDWSSDSSQIYVHYDIQADKGTQAYIGIIDLN